MPIARTFSQRAMCALVMKAPVIPLTLCGCTPQRGEARLALQREARDFIARRGRTFTGNTPMKNGKRSLSSFFAFSRRNFGAAATALAFAVACAGVARAEI